MFLRWAVLVIMLGAATAGCVVAAGPFGKSVSEGRCSGYQDSAQKQIDEAARLLRSVQDALTPVDAETGATNGLSTMRTGLTTIRDHSTCFTEKDRAWATQQLEVWDVDRAQANVMGCFYVKQQGGTVPDFCNFRQ